MMIATNGVNPRKEKQMSNNNLPVINMSDLDDSKMITIEDAARISGQTKLTVQKKFASANIQAVAMLRKGKVGRPSRLFNRDDFNRIYGLAANAPVANNTVADSVGTVTSIGTSAQIAG